MAGQAYALMAAWPARSLKDFPKIQNEFSTEAGLFWRKPKLAKEMQTERKIPVSVVHRDLNWSFKGAGIVQTPGEFCFKKAKDLKRLQEIPEHFKEVSFDLEKSLLRLKIQFLGRTREMDLQLFEEVTDSERRVYFRQVKGWLPGLEGVVNFKDQGRQATEVGLLAFYPGIVPWIPDWLFAVAAEGVMHHVAETLRKSLENDYK
jgi:hypothetical protein